MKLRSTFKVAIENSDGTKSRIEFKMPKRNELLQQAAAGPEKKDDFEYYQQVVLPAVVSIEGFFHESGNEISIDDLKGIDDLELSSLISWSYVNGRNHLISREAAEKKFRGIVQ